MRTSPKSSRCVKFFMLFAFMATIGAMAQTKPKYVLAIAADKMNILYAGIPNPVTIAASSVSSKKLKIDWGGATATFAGNGKYNLDVPSSLVGREVIITVKKGNNQVLGTYSFRVKSVPEPNVFVGENITNGKQTKEVLLVNPFVCVRMGSEFNYHLIWKVLSYNVTFVNNGVVEDSIFVEGAMFSDEVINKIKDAPLDMIIEFSDFKIQSMAGRFNIKKKIVIRIREECKLTKEYKDGYDNGYDKGHDKGYKEGYEEGYKDRYEEEEEYKDGYKKGYEEGYKNGEEYRYEEEYGKGYENGYKNGYEDRYEEGYREGYIKGYREGNKDKYEDNK